MKSNATLTETVASGKGNFRLTWNVDNARDVHRMVCHVRSILCARSIPNMIDVARDETAVTFVVAVPTCDVAKVETFGRMVADTFA